MNAKLATPVLLAVLAAAPALAQADAAKPPVCRSLPPDIKEAMRTMSYCITNPNPIPECARAGMDVQVYNNDPAKLPRAARGQQYWEGKIRKDDGAAGERRLVYLVTMGERKNVVAMRYYTPDHYRTFCEIQ
ncbi:ribonuclease domain-containing protein [Lysobacter firmicutimachus]|uniref:Ribonuclease domain-containing protein n=1 Tax=Lysobacter firmicutimachus TaxID=1792846 RepID=A0ABU8D272_9GAMM